MAKKKPKTSNEPMSFESSLADLKAIVHELEAGNLPLGDSLEKYELGIKHLKDCYKTLEKAQQKVELLVDLDDNGNLQTKSFEAKASTEEDDESADSEGSLF